MTPLKLDVVCSFVGWAMPTTRAWGQHTLVGYAHPTSTSTVCGIIYSVIFKTTQDIILNA